MRWWICRSPAHRGRRHRAHRLYAGNGWLGQWLEPLGVKVAFTRVGYSGRADLHRLPFVVRTVQPVLEDLDTELEEAAASLGADRGQTFLAGGVAGAAAGACSPVSRWPSPGRSANTAR
jgi:hypothetical protein